MKTATIRVHANDKTYLEKQARAMHSTPADIVRRLLDRQRNREAWLKMGEVSEQPEYAPLRDTALLVTGAGKPRKTKAAS